MRRIISSAALAALLACPAFAQQTLEGVDAGTYELDPNHAFLTWSVEHLGTSTYTVNFTDFDATLDFNPEDPASSSIEVTIDNPGEVIRDGMTAELTIALPSQRAHLIPQSAITLDDGGNMGVRIHEAGLARFVAIRILSDTADGFWVAGLPDSAEIIVIGQEFVRDGTLIQAVTADWKDAL